MKTLIELESKHLKEQGEGMENFVLNVEARNMLSVALGAISKTRSCCFTWRRSPAKYF